MEISITDFRCFHKPGPVEVRPLNILVGENSAGKTSFLAATRFMFDLFDRGERASFNKDPFHLGSYESIAHYRGGRFGRARSFGFTVKGAARVRRVVRKPDLFRAPETGPHLSYTMNVEFGNRRSQPALNFIKFDAGSFAFRVVFGDRPLLTVWTPSVSSYEFEGEPPQYFQDPSLMDLSFLELLLRSVSFRRIRDREEGPNVPTGGELETLFELYRDALRALPSNVYASAPVRSRPERTYNPTDFTAAPDGAHMPFVLAQLSYFEPKQWEEISSTLNEFGNSSGLFRDVSIRKIGNSTGGPFQIIVNMENRKSNLVDVGYGVSQALPIITDILRASRGSMFLFQQPEVHLHPKAQAELGTFFAQVVRRRRHTLFIETHSDHLIDRIRMQVRDGKDLKPSDVSILYFERSGHDVSIHNMTIDRAGNLVGAPPTYRTFFLEEEVRSLGVDLGDAHHN